MSTVELVLGLLLKFGPDLAQAVQKILSTPNPTQADWDAVFALAQKPYDSYIPKP